MSTPKFAETHNLVAFLEKPKESNGFEGIIDFLNASSIKYATLIEIKSVKPKAVTTAATIVTPTSSRPKAKGIAKDKGKAKTVELEKPLKKKDQIAFDEEVARNLEAQLQAELEEEERLSR
ncbi:hypothetical protein Tco_1273363 [Tanacetum coccineum]